LSFDWVSNPEAWIALLTLTAIEIVLGIDNIVFITILAGRLKEGQRDLARKLGLMVAMVTRILLLLGISWVVQLTEPLFEVLGHGFSGRDIILLFGGMFLLAKSTLEIHHMLEGQASDLPGVVQATFIGVVVQIGLLDIVFSLDSVITAVGLADDVSVMILAIVIAVMVMLFSAKVVGDFVEEHPTLKMLALSFLLLIGLTLVTEAFHLHIPKGYVYFAMAFSLLVEVLNLRLRTKAAHKVQLNRKFGG
jgi:predicted tellurium resistance membrane protein TerC